MDSIVVWISKGPSHDLSIQLTLSLDGCVDWVCMVSEMFHRAPSRNSGVTVIYAYVLTGTVSTIVALYLSARRLIGASARNKAPHRKCNGIEDVARRNAKVLRRGEMCLRFRKLGTPMSSQRNFSCA